MKPSKLLSIKSLTSKIHPQLPLNRKESQQLLKIVQTSFRKQLDLQHPPIHQGSPDDTSTQPQSLRGSAVNHIEALLSSPFIRPNGPPSGQRDNSRVPAAPVIDNAAQLVQDPAQWFQASTENGSADFAAAKVCLKMLVDTKDGKSPSLSVERIQRSGMGSKILHWIYTRRLEDAVEFHSDRQLSYFLILCLVAESRKYIVYDWALRLLNGNSPTLSSEKSTQYGRYLVEALVKAEFRLKMPLSVIVDDFLHILSALKDVRSGAMCYELFRAGLHINKFVLSTKSLETSMYDTWAQNVHLWVNGPFFTAQLELHHPDKPDARPAFKVLMDSGTREIKQKERQPIIDLCLDTARQLLNEQNNEDCLKVLQFAQKRFPEEFPRDESPQTLLTKHLSTGEAVHLGPAFSVG